jgi:hypothetical protein
VKPTPTIGASLPLTITGATATPTAFTVTITNPASGASYSNLYATISLTGMRGQKFTKVNLQYQDSSGTWCTPINYAGTATIHGAFVGAGSTCIPAYPASFSLVAGSSLPIHFRVAYPTTNLYGTQKVTVHLFTGSCSSATTCTAVTPLSGTAAPVASGSYVVVPTTLIATKVTDNAKHKATSSVHKGFNVALQSAVAPVTAVSTLSAPTGSVTYTIDGTPVTTSALASSIVATGSTPLVLYSSSGLSIGRHTVAATYSGDQIYAGSSLTETFTVIAAQTGTAFTCTVTSGGNVVSLQAYVTARGTVASPIAFATSTTTVQVKNVTVAIDVDPSDFSNVYNNSQKPATIGFSPNGSSNVVAKPITFAGVTGTLPDVSGTWSKVTPTTPITVNVPVAKGTAPGTQITIGASSIAFQASIDTWTCRQVSSPAVIKTVTVAGTTLTVSPTSPVAQGTLLTLEASVFPVPTGAGGTVTFDQTGAYVGTAPVSAGKASLSVTPTAGQHVYVAIWSGTLSVPQNTSDTVAVTVGVAPAVTTQPGPPTADLGGQLIFTAGATGTPAPTATWQVSFDEGTTWIAPPGTVTVTATGTTVTTSLTISSATRTDGNGEFRALFSNPIGTAPTNAVTPTVVVPPTVTGQPQGQTVAPGGSGTFTATATGSVLAVQWQDSTDNGGSWSNAPGTPKNTFASRTTLTSAYTTPATAGNGTQYRAVFSNGAGTADSNAATLTVTTTPPPPPPPPPVTTTTTTTTTPVTTTGGYRLVASNGAVYSYGNAPFYGSMGGQTLNKPIVGTASTPGDGGYWLVASDGGIFSFGNATFYGSMGGQPLNQPIVGIAATPDGKGYWEVASDGGIFAFGDAAFFGSMGGQPLNKPIVGIAATPDGKGYWEVASDGGIFAFGDATFAGSTGSLTLDKPIVSMASTDNGQGYWLVAQDGGVFAFGNAGFHGTVAGTTSASIVSLVPTADGGGYWETASNGQVFQFGDATSAGTALAQTATIVAMSD